MEPNFILNGAAHGSVASRLLANGMDVKAMQNWIGADGNSYQMRWNKATKQYDVIRSNTQATLMRDEWIQFDHALQKISLAPTVAFDDLRSKSTPIIIPNGMGKTILQYQDVSDINPATTSMDGRRKAEADRPVFDLKTLPLPITHKDFMFTAREIWVTRNDGIPLDTSMIEMANEKIDEETEKIALGVNTGITYGGGTVYGYTNFPLRITKTLTLPTAGGWTPATLITELLDMRALSVAAFHYGPWQAYVSPNWDQYMDTDYSSAKGDNTLRDRIGKIKGLSVPETLYYLTGYQILFVEMKPSVARAVIGMEVTPLEWQTEGGMEFWFKLMCIRLTQLRGDQNSNTGIVHGTAA